MAQHAKKLHTAASQEHGVGYWHGNISIMSSKPDGGLPPMLAAEGVLIVTVDCAHFCHALQRFCHLAPLRGTGMHCLTVTSL